MGGAFPSPFSETAEKVYRMCYFQLTPQYTVISKCRQNSRLVKSLTTAMEALKVALKPRELVTSLYMREMIFWYISFHATCATTR